MHLVKLILLSFLLVASSALGQQFDFDGAGAAVAAEAAPAGPSVPANLVGWWKLNDGGGTSAADSSGNGNTGTFGGTPTWGSGFLTFDGSGDYVESANEANFDFERTNSFSITAWIKINSSATGARIIASKEQTFGNSPGIDFRAHADNLQVNCYLIQADGNLIAASTAISSLTLNTWYFIAVTYDGSSANTGVKLYINGVDGTDFRSGSLSQSILNDNPFWIGKGLASDWYGDLDDVRVYDVELSAGQVSALYSGGGQ